MKESEDPKAQAEARQFPQFPLSPERVRPAAPPDYLTAALARLRAAADAQGFELGEVTLSFDEYEQSVELKAGLSITAELLDLTPAPAAPGATTDAGGQAEERLYSEAEAAARLGISKPSLLRLRRDGRIGFYRVGVRVVYSEAEHLRPFLDGCNQRPATAEEGQAPRSERVLPASED